MLCSKVLKHHALSLNVIYKSSGSEMQDDCVSRRYMREGRNNRLQYTRLKESIRKTCTVLQKVKVRILNLIFLNFLSRIKMRTGTCF